MGLRMPPIAPRKARGGPGRAGAGGMCPGRVKAWAAFKTSTK